MATVNSAQRAPNTDLLAAMNPKSSSSAAGNVTGSATSESSASAATAAQDRFMTLLVTQMKNQDPLNPLDNAQVTSQLAQLSTVTGIDRLNDTLQSMMAATQSAQSMQAASLIGHGVLVPGSTLALSGGKTVFGAELSGPADSVQVTISDAAGNPVRVLDLGARPAGAMALAWDGLSASGKQLPDGAYQLQVHALRGGVKLDAQALGFGEVISVSTGTGGAKLNLSGTQIPVSMADVRQIL